MELTGSICLHSPPGTVVAGICPLLSLLSRLKGCALWSTIELFYVHSYKWKYIDVSDFVLKEH